MRDVLAVNAPPVTTMSCEDARDCFPALLAGKVALTEWVLVEVHLRRCAECRREEARLQQLGAARRVAEGSLSYSTALVFQRRRLLTAAALERAQCALVVAIQVFSLGVGHSTDLIARCRAWLAMALEHTGRVVPGVTGALGLASTCFVAGIARLGALLVTALGLPVRVVADAIRAIRPGIVRSVRRALSQLVRAATIVLALAFALYALQRSDGPQEYARPPVPPDPEMEPAPTAQQQPEPTQPAPVLPLPSAEPKSASRVPSRVEGPRPSRVEGPRPSPARAVSSAPVSASETANDARVLPGPVGEPLASTSHVVGQLAPRDWSAVEREFTTLLVDVGGTELARWQGARLRTIEVVVPQSRYHEFAHGLARIGPWRLEAARSPLPDAVRITIRVSG